MTPFDPIRGFDGIRSGNGNLRGTVGSMALHKAMWKRILQYIVLRDTPYYAASTPTVERIGYGRRTSPSDGPFNPSLEARWLKVILESLYSRIVASNPDAPLNEVLASVLYYYEEQYAPAD